MNDQIKAIYAEMANKDLSCGCKVIIIDEYLNKIEYIYGSFTSTGCMSVADDHSLIRIMNYDKAIELFKLGDFKALQKEIKSCFHCVIGHPVMIGDVLEYCKKNIESNLSNEWGTEIIFGLLNMWEDKTKPIENQPQDCKDFVESLIPKI